MRNIGKLAVSSGNCRKVDLLCISNIISQAPLRFVVGLVMPGPPRGLSSLRGTWGGDLRELPWPCPVPEFSHIPGHVRGREQLEYAAAETPGALRWASFDCFDC